MSSLETFKVLLKVSGLSLSLKLYCRLLAKPGSCFIIFSLSCKYANNMVVLNNLFITNNSELPRGQSCFRTSNKYFDTNIVNTPCS